MAFAPLAHLRPSSARYYGFAAVLAAGVFGTFLYFGTQIDHRRLEQLRVATVRNQVTTMLGDMDSFLLGEKVEEFDADYMRMEHEFNALEGREDRTGFSQAIGMNENAEALRPVLAAHERFLNAVRSQRKLIDEKNIAAASRADLDETDPAFEVLNSALDQFDRRLRREAAQWTLAENVAVGTVLFAAAFFVAGLILRSQRRSASLMALEVQRRTIAASEARFASLIQNSSDVILLVDPQGVVKMVGGAIEQRWGRRSEDLLGRSLFDEIDTADVPRFRAQILDCIALAGYSCMAEISVADHRGVAKSFEVQITNLLDDPNVRGLLLTFHDLTERKKYEAELTYHAFHDRLTGLPNRALFLDRLSHRFKAHQRGGGGFSVLFIDLDNFKIVNDSLGHEAGDALLIGVAARLQAEVGPIDTVARLGGDEFTIILDEVSDPEEVAAIAGRIQKALVMPMSLGEREVFVSSSIGIVMADESGPDAASLLRDADTAMYHAKENGKASYAIFEPGMNLLALDRLELESDLRLAIQEEQFFLTYQPIIDIATGRLTEVEALIRWNHPTRGLVSPGSFIPLSEETGLICPIGRWALREAFCQITEWNAGRIGEERLKLSVNVSARQLQESDFVNEVRDLLEEMALDPVLVGLEVTETAMLKDLSKMRDVLSQLRKLGLRIVIDDFGTGYSSMAYLSQLPVDKLKIDRSFVIPLGQDERADGVVQAMITMARTLGLDITGEGVETNEQLDTLKGMGCDLGQGYLFDRPLDPQDVTKLLRRPETLRMAA